MLYPFSVGLSIAVTEGSLSFDGDEDGSSDIVCGMSTSGSAG